MVSLCYMMLEWASWKVAELMNIIKHFSMVILAILLE